MYANRMTMAPGVKQNFDEKVQEDFLFYLEHFKEAFDGLKSDCDKEICKVIMSLRFQLFSEHKIYNFTNSCFMFTEMRVKVSYFLLIFCFQVIRLLEITIKMNNIMYRK